VVLTGSSKAFAAGADIKEMKDKEFAEVYKQDFLSHWTQMTKFRKPIIAAVSGYAVSLSLHRRSDSDEGMRELTKSISRLFTAWRRLRIGNDVRCSLRYSRDFPH